MLQQAGFAETDLVGETGFNSSPVTKGVLVRGVKPLAAPVREGAAAGIDREKSMEPMAELVQRALELGAERAKIIDTATVAVAEWVRWKCLYGCPLYAKDPFHPPVAPDAESTKKVLGEYTKAILLNGPHGQILTEAAVKLEGEAYRRGYYKAFALTALVPGGAAACAPSPPAAEPGAT
jgi:hypothetical protein